MKYIVAAARQITRRDLSCLAFFGFFLGQCQKEEAKR
jgi:hypothetical protein